MVPIVVVAFEICAKAYDITVGVPGLESVQDFLIKLDMKPCIHLVEISICSLYLIIVRLTKIMNGADKILADI